jgi:two-component system LytT family sensor kinase
MKEVMKETVSFTRIEFWAATTLFVFAVFFFITDGREDIINVIPPNKALFDQAGFPFSFYRNYFVPQLVRNSFLFSAFLLLNFVVVPQLIKKEALFKNTSIVLLLFLLSGVILGTTDTYLKSYLFTNQQTEQQTYHYIFRISFLYAFWLLFMLGLYSVVKYAGIYLISNAEAIHEKYRFITRDGIVVFVVWMISCSCY